MPSLIIFTTVIYDVFFVGKDDLHGHDAEGPISDLLPPRYHQYLPKEILKSYVCGNQTYADRFQRLVVPSDIPVMAFDKKKPVYRGVLNSLNEKGKAALKEIRPWLVNLLVDWCNFDEIICNLERPGQSTGMRYITDSSWAYNFACHRLNLQMLQKVKYRIVYYKHKCCKIYVNYKHDRR